MKTRCLIPFMVVGALMLLCQPAIADDRTDLMAAFESYMKAFNTGDVETFMDFWVEGGIFLHPGSAFPHVIKIAGAKRYWIRWFETHTARMSLYKPDFLVIGNTGLLWGHSSMVTMNKEKGIGKNNFNQLSITWVKSEGKWKVAVWHVSRMPQETELF